MSAIKLTATAVNGIDLTSSADKIFVVENMSDIVANQNSAGTPVVTGNCQFAYEEIDGIVWMYTVNETLSAVLAAITSGEGVVSNIGTVSGATVSASEEGNSYDHVTVLTLASLDLGAVAAAADEAIGALAYTLPAGNIVVKSVKTDISLLKTGALITADKPDLGIGTTVASGAVAVLGGTPAFENISTGVAAADCNGTSNEAFVTNQVLGLKASVDHTIYINAADGWAGADAGLLASGTVRIEWTYLGA